MYLYGIQLWACHSWEDYGYSIKEKIPFKPDVALVLGSGLGNFPEGREIFATINYSEVKHFPISTVEGHKNRFVF